MGNRQTFWCQGNPSVWERLNRAMVRLPCLLKKWGRYNLSGFRTQSRREVTVNHRLGSIGARDLIIMTVDITAKIGGQNEGYKAAMREHGVGKMNEKGEMFAENCVNNRIVFSHKTIHKTTYVSRPCRRKPNRPHLYLQKVQKDHGRRQNKERSRCNIRSPPPGREIQIRVKETLVHKKVKGEIQCWIAQQHLSSKEAREHQGKQCGKTK